MFFLGSFFTYSAVHGYHTNVVRLDWPTASSHPIAVHISFPQWLTCNFYLPPDFFLNHQPSLFMIHSYYVKAVKSD